VAAAMAAPAAARHLFCSVSCSSSSVPILQGVGYAQRRPCGRLGRRAETPTGVPPPACVVRWELGSSGRATRCGAMKARGLTAYVALLDNVLIKPVWTGGALLLSGRAPRDTDG
jgi:hypothetical protein